METKPKRYRNKAILKATARDDAVIERLELPLKQFKESSIPMLSSAKYRARKGIRFVYGQLWNAGADFEPIGRYYSESGKEYRPIGWDGAAPLLLSVNLLPKWKGMLVPLTDDSLCPDRQLPEGDFIFAYECDFESAKSDYDRLCAQSLKGGWIRSIRVGEGKGLTFSGDEPWFWWQEQKTFVGSGHLPTVAELDDVEWSNELTWETNESRFVIMNSCCYGGDLSEQKPNEDYFKVRLEPGKYTVQFGKGGEYGPYLFRFVPKGIQRTPKKGTAHARKKANKKK